MERFLIRGGRALRGQVRISGAKNAALPVMAATLLTAEECIVDNVPCIEDIRTMAELLARLGCHVDFDEDRHRIRIAARQVDKLVAPEELATRMRASFLVTGPLLARFGEVEAPQPGGCAIGRRPVVVDIKGFGAMGASVAQQNGTYQLRSDRLVGQRLYLDYPSHTGTENLLMAASLAKGKTIIKNASAEPEVVSLASYLVAMGARIFGAGTSIIEVEGVDRLYGAHFRVIPDRIEAGTFAIAAAITGGEALLRDVIVPHMDPLTHKLRDVGIEVVEGESTFLVRSTGRLSAIEVQTLHYPGFPTDLQAAFATLLTQADGTSLVHERVYDARLQYAGELEKMGARISVSGQTATIDGPSRLIGTKVRALDIRAGAALILAGLVAEGETEISDIHHISRGYENIDVRLRDLGADIQRVED
ncbi:MAG: UDP-N-acetylglucosamine 1-carboxyvinyltransferase [Chloroflexi bacterium]|nr:UDP-N-acetylglucosamine 1-carboxyvinyltransferase [Chloroflexota bacterium]